MRGNSNPHSNKQQNNVGGPSTRNPQLTSKHRPIKSQYQFITQQDKTERQMLEVYTQPLENSRAHTPTQSMRGAQLQNSSPPVATTEINKLYHLFKAQQQIALNAGKSRSNSRSRSRSKKTRDHKDSKEYALLKSKKIYDKVSSQQWGDVKQDLEVKKQVLQFLQWQQKQASSNNPQYDMKDDLNYSSLRQLLPNDDRDEEELSPKFNQMLNDREHFSSILQYIESPTNMNRGAMKGADEEWGEPQVRESAVFQPNNHLIVNQNPVSLNALVTQVTNHHQQQQELASKAKHAMKEAKKQTEATIMRDSGIIHKYSNGISTRVGGMKTQKGRSPPAAINNSSIQGSIVSDYPLQPNNRGSYQKRSPVQQQQPEKSKFANQKQTNFLSKLQSIKSGGGGTKNSGNNQRQNADSLIRHSNQRSTVNRSPETNYGQDDSDQS